MLQGLQIVFLAIGLDGRVVFMDKLICQRALWDAIDTLAWELYHLRICIRIEIGVEAGARFAGTRWCLEYDRFVFTKSIKHALLVRKECHHYPPKISSKSE